MCLIWVYVLVVFFKQKTAYEMRISDWSSDVCSSDLVRRSVPRPEIQPFRHEVTGENHLVDLGRAVDQTGLAGVAVHPFQHGILGVAARPTELDRREIGRASCRERVCQYV